MSGTAIIAGQGGLPAHLVSALKAAGTPYLVGSLDGFPPDLPGEKPITFRLERLVPFLDHLVSEGVKRVVFAGAVRRPKLEAELFDARTATLVPRLLKAVQPGDDATLRVIIGIFEEAGLTVVGAHEIAPGLLPPEGILTRTGPLPAQEGDAELGEVVVADMGRSDTGQACIIAGNRIVRREGPEGTDAMLRALIPSAAVDEIVRLSKGPLDNHLVAAPASQVSPANAEAAAQPLPATGGLLFKAPKPGQDIRVDMPVIGPQTAMLAAEAGLSGIVVEAGGVMVLDLERVVKTLDGLGMFLWVRPRGWQR